MRKYLLFTVGVTALAQSVSNPSPLGVLRVYGITSANQYIDQRPINRQANYHSFCATGSGSWSVQMEYSDTSNAGPWTSFGTSGAVNNTSSSCVGNAIGYHNFIRLNTTVGSTSSTYTSWKDAYIPLVGSGGGGGSGTVTIFSGSGPSWLTWSVANPTTTPAATLTATTGQSSHQVIGTCGSATTFGPCGLVAGDLPLIPLSGMSNLAANSIIGNNTASPATPLALTEAQVATMLNGQTLFTLTTTGSSGAATYSGGTLNIPQYSGGGGSSALSAITAATGSNTIASGDNPQIWNWATTTSNRVAMTFGETTASTSTGSPYIVTIKTASGSTAIPLNVFSSLSGAQTLPAIDVTPTWNTSGVVDGAIRVNVTNTASGSGSLLAQFKVGGTSQWSVDKAGNVVSTGTVQTGSGGAVGGSLDMAAGTAASVPANSFGWGVGATMTTSVRLISPNTVPSANQVMLFGAPSSNVSTFAWTGISGTGSFCMTTSCTMITPALGTPSALVLTSATGLPTAGLVNNAVNSSKMAVVNTRRVCDIAVGDETASAITNGQLGPQKRICYIPAASTIVEMDVAADGGTPNVIVGNNTAGSVTNIVSSALATAASGGIACSNTGGTTGIDGATTCSGTLQNTSLAAGSYLELVSGTAGGTAKLMTIHVIYTVN